jgi:Adenylate and Guanylate cyclase catalytic domain
MESNGQKGRIHVSEATANLLKESGYDRWVSQRKDLVEAKGKGLLQTYWVAKSVFSEGEETTNGSSGEDEFTDHDDAEEIGCLPGTERIDV